MLHTLDERGKEMATYRNPTRIAPLEVIERLLELRAESGSRPMLFIHSPTDLAITLDIYGFDGYALERETDFNCGGYRALLMRRGARLGDFEATH